MGWVVVGGLLQILAIPCLPSWPLILLTSLPLYILLAILLKSFLRSFKVWRSSLASRYEHQCQKHLRAFNLQVCDGMGAGIVRPSTPLLQGGDNASSNPPAGQSSSPSASNGKSLQSGIDHAVGHRAGAGYHLGFLRRMPRRLVAFLEAYREEYRARRKYAIQGIKVLPSGSVKKHL